MTGTYTLNLSTIPLLGDYSKELYKFAQCCCNDFAISHNMKLSLLFTISKLRTYRFQEELLDLIRSYLCDRLNRVKLGVITSEASGSGLREAVLRDRPKAHYQM